MCRCDLSEARRLVTVEPVLFFGSLVNALRGVVFQTLLYQMVCHKDYNQTVCDNLEKKEYLAEETHVQEVLQSTEQTLYNLKRNMMLKKAYKS